MPDCLVASDCTIDVLRSPAELDRLDAEWSALFEQQATPAPALHPDWVRLWWQTYGPAYGDPIRGLRVVTLRRDGRLLGVLPLYERSGGRGLFGPRRLGFVSTGEREDEETCPEYLDLLRVPGEEEVCQAALKSLLGGDELAWDELDLPDVPADSPLCALGKSFFPPVAVGITPRGECPIADLAGGFEAYLGRLSSSSRQQFRRQLRAAAAAGLVLDIAQTEEEVTNSFDQLIQLHQARWAGAGKPGCFASPRFTAFHRELARRWVPAGRAILARLTHDGTPLAVLYGFVAGAKFHFYQSGVRTEAAGPVRYPGFVAHLRLMEQLALREVREYDFLQGAASYKDRFTTRASPLVRVRFTKPSLRGYCKDLLAAGWRRSRDWLQPR